MFSLTQVTEFLSEASKMKSRCEKCHTFRKFLKIGRNLGKLFSTLFLFHTLFVYFSNIFALEII